MSRRSRGLPPSPFRRFNSSPELIRQVVLMYVRFGMSLEAIYARKGRSVYGLPLDRFNQRQVVESAFNIRHCYQVGAEPIWWWIGQFLSGNTHDPKDVFLQSRAAFWRGENPVTCIAQKYDFSGSPHCILPVGWAQNGDNWTMTICDPNSPGKLESLAVNAAGNMGQAPAA